MTMFSDELEMNSVHCPSSKRQSGCF